MISTSGILSTGEKKWIPMKSSWRFTPVARPVMGIVEVLEPRMALGSTMSSISWNTFVLEFLVLEDRFDHEVDALGNRRHRRSG